MVCGFNESDDMASTEREWDYDSVEEREDGSACKRLPEKADKMRALFALAVTRDLSRAACAVGAVLVDCFNANNGKCFPSVAHIEAVTRLKRRAVFLGLRALERRELIQRKTNAGPRGANLYDIRWDRLNALVDAANARGQAGRAERKKRRDAHSCATNAPLYTEPCTNAQPPMHEDTPEPYKTTLEEEPF